MFPSNTKSVKPYWRDLGQNGLWKLRK